MKAPLRAAFHHTCLSLSTLHRYFFAVSALLFIAFTPLAAWTLIDDFESRDWYDPHWVQWFRLGTATYGNYQGRNCVKLTGPTDKGAQSIITQFFAGENWSNVTSIRLDIYTQTSATNMTVKLEPYSPADTPCIDASTTRTMSVPNSWQTYSWNYSILPSSPVGKIQIIFDALGANEATFYMDNLRLVVGGTEYTWDDFEEKSRQWTGAGNAVPLIEHVSHNASTSTTNGGAGLLWWQHNVADNYAGLALPPGFDANWRSEQQLRADVRCSDVNVPITFYFWYSGGWGEEAAPRYVSQADTWQTLCWELPPGTDSFNVTGFNVNVKTDASHPSGTFYIDNLYIGSPQTNITVVKSTSTATARPGEEITYTITYGNSGADGATNLYIYDAIPFNTVLAAQPAAGSADAVEYYVGSGWTSAYDPSAAKIRWRDNSVAAGESGRSVSFKVKPR